MSNSTKRFVLFLYFLLFAKFYVTENVNVAVNKTSTEYAVKRSEGNYSYLITGGFRPAVHYLTKYMVSLRERDLPEKLWGSNHFCAGSIIGVKTILTAAHCVADYKIKGHPPTAKKFIVVSGIISRLEKMPFTITHDVASVRFHEKFKTTYHNNDIALVLLVKDMPLDDFRAVIPLINRKVTDEDVCTTVGWGRIFTGGPMAAEALYAVLNIISFNQCRKKYRGTLHTGMICAKDKDDNTPGSCQGDSGGPLFCDDKLTGVVSFGILCGDRYPSVYTSVFYHREFINGNILRCEVTKVLLGLQVALYLMLF